MGAANQRPAAKRLLCERAARRDGCRFARCMRSVFRHQRWAGVCVGRCGRQLESDRARFASGAECGGADAAMRMAFFDTNVLLYAAANNDPRASKAEALSLAAALQGFNHGTSLSRSPAESRRKNWKEVKELLNLLCILCPERSFPLARYAPGSSRHCGKVRI